MHHVQQIAWNTAHDTWMPKLQNSQLNWIQSESENVGIQVAKSLNDEKLLCPLKKWNMDYQHWLQLSGETHLLTCQVKQKHTRHELQTVTSETSKIWNWENPPH